MITPSVLTPSGPLPAYPLLIRSRILDAEVWIIPAGWTEPVPGPTYSHSEVAALDRHGVTPEALRGIHVLKLAVDGEVLGDPDTWGHAVTWIPVV